jgi:hypothetical protein
MSDQIARTIHSQIRTLDSRALLAWGAKDYVMHKNALSFKSSGLATWKGTVHIEYVCGADSYTIKFFKVRSGQVKFVKEVEDVYATELVKIIDSVVQ